MATTHAKTNGKSQPKAADVQAAPVPPVQSFTPNEDQTLNLNITQGWNRQDWVNIFGGLSIAQAEAYRSGNQQQMFAYWNYSNQIGMRLGLGTAMAGVSDLPPPKTMTAGAG